MITRIAIENFKGIRDRVEIELRPITLLFGANSAGKSSLLHAIHYAREVFERHNLNADRTIAGGDLVDLGGFDNFVHGGFKPSPRWGVATTHVARPRDAGGDETATTWHLLDKEDLLTWFHRFGPEARSKPGILPFTVRGSS